MLNSIFGVITSPNFPCYYPNDAKCQYLIKQLNPGTRITVSFKQFSLQGGANCIHDSIRIYDGQSTNATQIGPIHGYCGNSNPPTVMSTTNSLLIVFVSDARTTSTGFQIDYNGKLVFSFQPGYMTNVMILTSTL